MKDRVKNRLVFFVLTKVVSIKILQQKIGVRIAEQSNVIVDRKDNIDIPTVNGIYPCIIKMDKGNMINHEFQSPHNSAAFAKLDSFLDMNAKS